MRFACLWFSCRQLLKSDQLIKPMWLYWHDTDMFRQIQLIRQNAFWQEVPFWWTMLLFVTGLFEFNQPSMLKDALMWERLSWMHGWNQAMQNQSFLEDRWLLTLIYSIPKYKCKNLDPKVRLSKSFSWIYWNQTNWKTFLRTTNIFMHFKSFTAFFRLENVEKPQ